jgi:class 3 adenylate cyclase
VGLKQDLEEEIHSIFRMQWQEREGRKIPDIEALKLGNDAVKLEGTVLYADLAESTNLVDKKPDRFAAEIYKAYLHCASKIIRAEGGEITAFDGDRVMAVFLSDTKNTSAARCSLKINYAVKKIINPGIKKVYPKSTYEVKQAVGVDTSVLFVAKTGIRNSNDLVWVGPAANYAAKLCGLRREGYASWITERVYKKMRNEIKIHNGKNVWEPRTWTAMKNMRIYRSAWTWNI